MHSAIKRFFLWRRGIDPILLSAGAAMIMLPGNVAVYLIAIFEGIGVYLIAGRHRSIRRIDPNYLIAAAILAVGSLLIGLANGSLPQDFRWASYPAYYLAVLPIAAGTVLVRDPLRQFVLGARIAVVLLAIWGMWGLITTGHRYGFGSNQANAAFAVTFMAIAARINVSSPPRLLSSSRFFFYAGLLGVFATGTRAPLVVFAAGLAFDCLRLLKESKGSRFAPRAKVLGVLSIVFLLIASVALVVPKIRNRIVVTGQEIIELYNAPDVISGGLSIRLALWRSAVEVIEDHPLLGIGGLDTKPALLANIPADNQGMFAQFTFSHNFILDEALQRGVVGVALLLGFFGYTIWHIARHSDGARRENLALMGLLIVTFGLLHHLLLVDRHVALIAIYFTLLVTDNRLRQLRARLRLPG